MLALLVALAATALTVPRALERSDTYPAPGAASLAGLTLDQRIVAVAQSQVGYHTDPPTTYCNKFSAYWRAGAARCPGAARSEEWCADFAAWAWRLAGVRFTYGFGRAQVDAAAASFYLWGVAHGTWHRATRAFVAAPGDVAVYGLRLGAHPTASHVAIVTSDPRGQRGPDVIDGDGNRTGFSVVEAVADQVRADTHGGPPLSGYVSPR